MSTAGSVSAEELVRALHRKATPLPVEIAAFIAFSGCESMIEQGPRDASLAQVRIGENGSVTLAGSACDEVQGARSLHRILQGLLRAAGRSLPPALQRMLERPDTEVSSLQVLHDQLEATLVPLNRTASRRVLSRFARDAAHPLIDAGDVDAALNTLLSEERPANDAPARRQRSLEPEPHLNVDLLEGLEIEGDDDRYPKEAVLDVSERARRTSTRPSMAPSSIRGTDSLRSQASQLEELGSPRGSRKLFIGFSLVAIAVVIVIIASSVRDERAREERERAAADARGSDALEQPIHTPLGGNLRVHVSEPNAQVLRYVGNAPVTLDKLPVGVAHELVATAPGHRPSRVLVPANADWEATADGARYELALQLTPSDDAREELALGPSRFSAQGSQPSSRRGSVRVVVTPKGARVYQLVGFSPDVTVEDLPIDGPQELLIYRDKFTPVVRVLQPSDFKLEDGKRHAEIDVKLVKR